jgi:phosphoglycerol geranylgeranyltransferase
VTLIVGGGIRTPKAAAERVKAGADIIVTGTLVERAADRAKKIKEIVKAIKSACGASRRKCTRRPCSPR